MTTTVANRSRRRFCGRKCRQSAFRLRRRSSLQEATASPGAFHYADPPYPGTSSKYYRDEASFAGEVDFPALIASLAAAHDNGDCLGWALSTSARSLRALLPLCPPEARVCAWVKPIAPSPRTFGLHNTWEPLIVVVGRRQRPGKRDWLRAMPARMEGSLPGRKPIAFCAWLFELLGMRPGDTLVDLFPGTGIISRAWDELSSGAGATSLLEETTEASSTAAATMSSQVLSDVPESATVACRGELRDAGAVVCRCAHGHDGVCGYQAVAAAAGRRERRSSTSATLKAGKAVAAVAGSGRRTVNRQEEETK